MSTYYGEKLKVTIDGASHAEEISMIMEGFPSGLEVDLNALQAFLTRRAPGRHPWETSRKEADIPSFTEGITDGKTNGGTLRAVIKNTNRKSRDYDALQNIPRPGHADYTAFMRYKGEMDMHGGGPFSGRMTAPLCIAGGLCLQYLSAYGIRVMSRIYSIGNIRDDSPFNVPVAEKDFPVSDDAKGAEIQEMILSCKENSDSVGGIVETAITGFPAGIGGPMFEGLEGRMAAMFFSIPAVKGFESGAGFESTLLKGSENNDAFIIKDGIVATATNNCGGILGGISNGMPITFRTAFKPTPSIARTQRSINLDTMTETELVIHGRHDPCIVPRAVPVTEAAAAIVLADVYITSEIK